MKFLLVLAVVVIAIWLWRRARRPGIGDNKPAGGTAPPGKPQEMARCAQCGLHLPLSETVAGKRGVYCSAAHRQLEEP